MFNKKLSLPTAETALPGRDEPLSISARHAVHGHMMQAPFPDGYAKIIVGLGCFWGAERLFWQVPGVYSTAVGYAAGFTPNPSYEEVCSGLTGHNEVVLVVFDPNTVTLTELLQIFFEAHDPTQGMRQGNDRGTQYRSGIYYTTESQRLVADTVMTQYQKALSAQGYDQITTELLAAEAFYYAEEYHQQYLHKNPQGYCGLAGTGVSCR